MAGLIKGQILKHLSKFTKNLSPDQINVSTLKGESELNNLVLDDHVLTELMDLPSWLRLKRATCNKLALKIQWTKLKSQPIRLYLDEVVIDMETCETPRDVSSHGSTSSYSSGGKYGFAERIIDGMFVSINSVVVNFRALKFHASIQLSRILIQSKTPTWQHGDLRLTRIKDDISGEIILFKEAEWQTLRIEANALDSADSNLPTTPLRLIANQSKIRITLKKKMVDSSLVASRLQVNLDDLLWVLTDSQLKAALVFINSLRDVVKRSAQLSKKMAADKIKKQSKNMSPTHSASQAKHAPTQPPPQRQGASSKKAQHTMRTLFERYDIIETSYHLYTGRVDLHLCDDACPEDEESRRKVEGGAMQITLFKLTLDYYPYHAAGDSRSHWVRYDENMAGRDAWAQELLNAFKEDVRTARDFYTSPQTSPTHTYSSQHSPAKPPPLLSSSSHTPTSPRTKPTKLLESCFVLRLEDFALYRVSTASDHQRSTPCKFLSSDKKQLRLPPEMSSIHMEYTDYYFPEGIDFPGLLEHVDDPIEPDDPSNELCFVPHSNIFIVINPICLKLDYLTILWLNAFALNLYQKAEVPVSEGPKMHTDIKLSALMPRIILPSEEEITGQSDRPDGLQIQISRATLTNCQIEHKSSNQELLSTLDAFDKAKLFQSADKFPHASMDYTCVPDIFIKHVDKSNGQYLDKGIESVLVHGKLPADMCNVPNGDITGLTKSASNDSSLGLTYYNMRTDSFKLNASKDVWCAVLDQIWAEFVGVPSSKNRPVSFIESFPVTIWLAKLLPSEDSEPHDEGVETKSASQSDWSTSSELSHSVSDHSIGAEVPKTIPEKTEPPSNFPASLEAHSKTTDLPSVMKSEDQKLADTHMLIRISSKINLQLNHYQYLFLMRLLETITKYQSEMEEDAVFLTKAPLPLSNTVAAVLIPEIQLALVCPAIPELPPQHDGPDDSEVLKEEPFSFTEELANHDTSVDDAQIPIGSPEQVEYPEMNLPPSRDGSRASSFSSSTSSSHDLLSNHPPSKLPPSPVISIQEVDDSSLDLLLASSDSSPRYSADLNNHSAQLPAMSVSYKKQGSGEVKKSLVSGFSHFSKGIGSSYNKITERMKQNMGKPANLLEVGDDGDDWETMSMKSGASSDEDEMMLIKLQTGPELPAFEHKYNLDDSCHELATDDKEEGVAGMGAQHARGVVSVVCFRLVNVATSLQMLGKDLAMGTQVDYLLPEEHGNINLEGFQAQFSTTTHQSDLDLPPLPEAPITLRYQTGPSAEQLAPTSADLGHLQLNINKLQLCLLQSSLTNLLDLIEDEKIPATMPLNMELRDTSITLKNDKFPTHMTSPGAPPAHFHVDQALLHRGPDGVFHLTGVSDIGSEVSRSSVVSSVSPPPVTSPPLSVPEAEEEELPHEVMLRELQAMRAPSAPRSNEALEQENDMLRRHLEKIGKMSTATGGFNVENLQRECDRWKKEAQGIQKDNEQMMEELADRNDEVTLLQQERDSLLATIQLMQEELSHSERMRSHSVKNGI